MSDNGNTTTFRALRVDPKDHSVTEVHMSEQAVLFHVSGENMATFELGASHALVIDLDADTGQEPARFRFDAIAKTRPFFGEALVLGLTHGTWSNALLEVEVLAASIIWETWDPAQEGYVVHSTTTELK
jgi:hypothetical protein